MRHKIKELITVLIIQLVLTIPFYTSSVYGLTVSNVKVTKVTSSSATIDWSTDNISNGRVRYGPTTALGFTQRHDNFIDNHTVALFNGIDSDTKYFFAIESTDLAGNNAIDNNSNNFYTFKTTDITPPPQVTGLKAVPATSNSIFLMWNAVNITDLNHYVIYRNRIPVANSTTNSFNDTSLETNRDFSYKVSAVDNSSNEGPQSDTLIASTSSIDSIVPIISNIDALPITDTAARITWLTNENATTFVLYGINKTDKTKSSNELETNHTIVIDGLTKNAQVLFIAKSCDASNNCANSSLQSFLAGKDTKAPFINISIPKCVNRRFVDIIGSTEPFSTVTLFVNNMNVPKRSLSSSEVVNGKFVFTQIQLEKENVIKIVMIDKSGNKAQKIFETSVDTEDPIVQLSEVPSLTSRANLTFNGNVNEPVTIKVFVDTSVNESSVPSQIAGLNATKVGKNSVEFRWDEIKSNDFSHYVVYRNDIGAIALTKPSNFNLFIDALVDSGKSYTYQVSAVNILGREGPKSEPLTVTTEKNGQILNLNPPLVDALEDFRKPVLVTNATASFNFGVRLAKGDGTYKIKTIIEDCAENLVIFQKDVTLDTKKLEVKILSPPSGASIFENAANEVDIIGKTKPNSRVHLFVDRTPFTFFNHSFEISGLPNEVQNLPEAQLDAKCRSAVSTSFCRTGADFSVDADSNGNFKFENVDMTVIFGGAARLAEVPPTEFRDTVLNPEAQESKRVMLVVISTDLTGQRGVATQAVRIVTCWSGNQSWDIIPLTQHQYPTFLSTERLAEGTETIYFFFNYTYIGRGTNARISDITLSKACGTKEVLDPRFNISCQVLPSGDKPTKLGSSKTISYSAITIGRFPGMDRFLEGDWKSFLKAINKELTFPFKVRIAYEHDVINDDGKSNRIRETQTLCEQVTYDVDDAIIDPRRVLPDWLLFDFVDFLQESVQTITELQQKVDALINYVAIGCLGSIFANGVIKIWRNWAELWDEKLFKIKEIANIQFKLDAEQKNTDCKELAQAVQKAYGSLKLKYFSDADLEKCFPSSASAWKTEAKVYKSQRWTCDRIFGHSSPSGWTENVGDDELHRTITSEKTCASDLSVGGQRLRVESCKDLEGKYPQIFNKGNQPIGKKCFQIQSERWSPKEFYLWTLDEQQQDTALTANKIYKLTPYESRPSSRVIYALKTRSDNFYMTSQPQTCKEICGIEQQAKGTGFTIEGSQGIFQNYVLHEGKLITSEEFKKIQQAKKPEAQQQEPSKNQIKVAACMTVNQCSEWHTRAGPKAGGIFIGGEIKQTIENYRVESRGYTEDCFYGTVPGKEKDVSVVSDTDRNSRHECCCVNGQASQFKTVYYQPEDKDGKLPSQFQKPVHKSKKVPEVATAAQVQELAPPSTYEDMEWSYRYARIGYLNKKYNPNRYISGRDQSACLGQDHPLSKLAGKEREVVTLEPAKQDAVVLWPCFYLTGINQRLQRIKVIANAMSNCLVQVRTTGRADTGVCKELFTQHLCDALWQGIRFFIDGCSPEYIGPPKGDPKYLEDAQLLLKGVFQGIAEAQSEIAEDYSNTKLNDLLGAGEESVARKVCLAAFGYDWEINARNLIDAAYSAPFATLVQAVTRSREFLTIEPNLLRPKYEYRTSWIINPGCDLERYDIQLACVTKKELDKYPNSISCGSVGAFSIGYTGKAPIFGETSTGFNQCDCLELTQEQTESFASASRIKQNALEDKSLSRVIESSRRFDHIKITLRPDRKIAPAARTNCFPTGYEEGIFYFPIIDKTARDILDCTVDVSSGLFTCGGGVDFFNKKGIAEVLEIKINDKRAEEFKEAEVGKSLDIVIKVRKTGIDKCARVTVTDLAPLHEFIRENGTTEVRFVTQSLAISGKENDIVPQRISIKVLQRNNNKDVDFRVEFEGNTPEPGKTATDTSFSLDDENDKIFAETISKKSEPVKTSEFKQWLQEKYATNEIILEKDDVKIKIEGVTLNPPRLQGQPYRNGGIITIKPQSQTAQLQGSQRKTVLVELFHANENNPNECNFGDRIAGNPPYNFVVTAKSTQTTKPLINIPTVDKKISKKGDKVTISTKIVDAFQVGDVDVTLTAPDGNVVDIQKTDPRGDNYVFIFDTNKAPVAGIYKGVITAKSKKPDREPNTQKFEFEIQCGGENVYGRCQDAACSVGRSITEGFNCKKDFVEDFDASGNPIAVGVTQPCCRVS